MRQYRGMKNTNNDEDGKRTILIAIIVTAIAVTAFLLPSAPDEVLLIEEPMPSIEFINHAEASEPKEVLIATTSKNHIGDMAEMVVEKPVEKKLHPELEVICGCESAGHTHKDKNGVLLSGYVDSDDKGLCQINTRYHGETMQNMGLDINNDEDYFTYANHLFETQGRQPWKASASCWAPIIGY